MIMPTTREKSSRRRTTSTSSESGPNNVHSSQGHTPNDEMCNSTDLVSDVAGLQIACQSITLPCCNPRGCVLGPIGTSPSEANVIRMQCSNEKCPFSTYMHTECFDSFEEQVLSCLRGMSRAKNWSEKQRKQNLWTKKGYDLIYKFCTCRCSKGTLKKDLNHVLSNSVAGSSSFSLHVSSSSIASSSVTITQTSDKTKKKRKKSASLSDKGTTSHVLPSQQLTHSRSRSHKNSDSVSSDNGCNYMQPFTHRTDYSIFDQLLPRSLVNSYHIKMEDDGYAAGDDTRSLVLSCLAFHHKSQVPCVLCNTSMEVYDRFPLINGTFYLSPILPKTSSLEVESKGDDPLYMSAICVYCLSGLNQVFCTHCHTLWNGKCHQIGTMYTYDVFASNPCCVSAVQCKSCKCPLVELPKLSLSFTQLSSLYDCTYCGVKDYHFIRPIGDFIVGSKHSDSYLEHRPPTCH